MAQHNDEHTLQDDQSRGKIIPEDRRTIELANSILYLRVKRSHCSFDPHLAIQTQVP